MTANTKPEIVKRVIELLASTFELSQADIDENDGPEQIEKWDSFGHVRLMMELEFEFSIRFATDDINRPTTIGEVASLVESIRNGE